MIQKGYGTFVYIFMHNLNNPETCDQLHERHGTHRRVSLRSTDHIAHRLWMCLFDAYIRHIWLKASSVSFHLIPSMHVHVVV